MGRFEQLPAAGGESENPAHFMGFGYFLGMKFCKSGCGIKVLALGTQVRPFKPVVSDAGINNHKIQEGKSRHSFISGAFLKDPKGMVCENRAMCSYRDLNRAAAVNFPRKSHQCGSIQS